MKVPSLVQPAGETASGSTTRTVSRLGVLLSLALILQLVEGMLPPLGVPGMKLGLANTVVLLTLQLWGWREAFILVVLRQILGGLLAGKLLSVGFYLGLSGGLASIAMMQLWLVIFGSRENLLTTSIAGAVAHNWGQLGAALWLMNHEALIWYLPFLTIAAIPCGFLVACLCRPLLLFYGKKNISWWPSGFQLAALLFLVILGVGFPLAQSPAGSAGDVARIQVDGEVITVLDLSQDGKKSIKAGDHSYIVEVKDGTVAIVQADCPDQVCVQTGKIRYQGQSIVCIPGELIITVDGSGKPEVDGYLP